MTSKPATAKPQAEAPKQAGQTAVAQTSASAVTATAAAVDSSSHLDQASGSGPSVISEEIEVLMTEVLSELDFLNHQEKKIPAGGAPSPTMKTLQEAVSAPMKSIGNRLLGILGRCGLKGHIAHFYNLQFEIERHIKTLSEFQDPRFVKAYDFLKANPSAEAVFVYENKMVAANRRDGRLSYTAI